jgi:hypothetical protein
MAPVKTPGGAMIAAKMVWSEKFDVQNLIVYRIAEKFQGCR